MMERDENLKSVNEQRKPKTKYIVKSYFIGTKPLKELIERLASKDAKESKNIEE